MNKPKVSVVVTARNEYPVILGTILSFYNELEHFDYPFEIIVVDNMSDDLGPQVLKDRFRRWIRLGILKVINYDKRPANVLVRNVGARAATGKVVILCDAHLSIKTGTLDLMIKNWQTHGGLWHSATIIWGDTSDIRCYGYKLKLEEKFWGNLSKHLPDQAKDEKGQLQPYTVPMASHCLVLAGRKEYLDFGGYSENFRCYGGGEPYLDLKWWLFGSKVWVEPRGLVRHAFGTRAIWKKSGTKRKLNRAVMSRDGQLKTQLEIGDEYLHYARGYAWNNEQLHFNFMLSAYTIGGYEWLQKIYRVYWNARKGNPRYLSEIKRLRGEVLRDGATERAEIAQRQKLTLDQLLKKKPWQESRS